MQVVKCMVSESNAVVMHCLNLCPRELASIGTNFPRVDKYCVREAHINHNGVGIFEDVFIAIVEGNYHGIGRQWCVI